MPGSSASFGRRPDHSRARQRHHDGLSRRRGSSATDIVGGIAPPEYRGRSCRRWRDALGTVRLAWFVAWFVAFLTRHHVAPRVIPGVACASTDGQRSVIGLAPVRGWSSGRFVKTGARRYGVLATALGPMHCCVVKATRHWSVARRMATAVRLVPRMVYRYGAHSRGGPLPESNSRSPVGERR